MFNTHSNYRRSYRILSEKAQSKITAFYAFSQNVLIGAFLALAAISIVGYFIYIPANLEFIDMPQMTTVPFVMIVGGVIGAIFYKLFN